MINKFIPTYIADHFNSVNIEILKANNYKLILCDIDNTLVGPDDPYVSDQAKEFLNKLLAENFEVVLISNNTTERVDIFNEPLKLKTYPMALKPLPKTYKKIKKDFKHIKSNEIISIGDQVLTDVLGSNLSKIDVVLVNQIEEKDLMVTKLNRFLEKIVIKYLKFRGKWPNENM